MILFANFTACNDEVVSRLDMVIKSLCIKRYSDELKQFSYALFLRKKDQTTYLDVYLTTGNCQYKALSIRTYSGNITTSVNT